MHCIPRRPRPDRAFWLIGFTVVSIACAVPSGLAVAAEAAPRVAASCLVSGVWRLTLFDPSTGDATLIDAGTSEGHAPSFATRRPRIAFSDGLGGLVVAEPRRPVTPGLVVEPLGPVVEGLQPAPSPDGERLAFSRLTFASRSEDSELWVLDLGDRSERSLHPQGGLQKYPAWSPDGARLAYTSGRRVSPTRVVEDLWLIDAQGPQPEPLLANGSSNIQPDWSPNGQWLAYASDLAGQLDIWLIPVVGGEPRRLTQAPAMDADPAWSPDGAQIAFVSTRAGQMDIWLMAADGSGQRQLTGHGDQVECKDPAWLPSSEAWAQWRR